MFEGLVRQLILGYLGQYIKDIHTEQLKITLWNEEVLLENVELILEAFDYLELPFSLKQGRVGRLSIKIPWKKLGWDPIIIILEDILVSASQRDDEEWSTDAVEKREFAGKKAKLAAAELSKLSQRVCDNQTGKSFISYMTAKIIDGIQVSIRNVHFLYGDMSDDKVQTVFGLKLTSLTAMKQNLVGISSGKVRVGQVNKLIEIQGLEIYCRTFHRSGKDLYTGNGEESMSMAPASIQSDEHIHFLAPVNVCASLSVNRSGRLENNVAQYSIDVELSGLVLSLDKDQLEQILYLYDYLCICRLREKYGRYRPWGSPLSQRLGGWQIRWWHYAQQSVLSDVRKRLKRTSWKYLGERLGRRRRYVKLYKLKLECLRKEELLDDALVSELDQMEKESDLNDILSYRSAAEHELQEFLVDSASAVGANGANTTVDKSLDDDQASSKPQGWLKWLSRGMLGAGGTDDSSQFSGVISDEVIKDIYEATKFHPAPSPVLDAAGSDGLLLFSIKFSIHRISATLRNKKFDRAIAELVCEGNVVECMIWEESAVVTASVNAVEMMNPLNEQVILLVKRVISEEHFLEAEKPCLTIKAYIPKENHEDELTLKVLLEPIEVTCDPTFLFNIMELYTILSSFKFHKERVLKSLNGINDVKSRLISKADYILSSRNKVMWDISLINVKMIIPWENGKSETNKLVLGLTAVTFASKRGMGSFAPNMNVPSQFMRKLVDTDSTSELLEGIQIQDLYDHFEIKIIDFEINLFVPFYPYTVPVLEKLNAASALACCIVQDESLLKTLEVYIVVATLLAHFSPSICSAAMGLVASFNMLHHPSDFGTTATAASCDMELNEPKNFSSFGISFIANLESASVIVDLENGLEASCTLTVSLHETDMRFVVMEFTKTCLLYTRAIKVTSRSCNSEDDHVICLSENIFSTHSPQQHEMDVRFSHEDELKDSANGCLMLHYEGDLLYHKCSTWLSDVDLHFYPHIIGLLVEFFNKLSTYGPSHAVKNQNRVGSNNILSGSYFGFQRFGCSNILETSSSEWESISVDHYPFITIYNDRSLINLESSLINISPDWKKVLKIRESKINSSKFSAKKEFEKLCAPLNSKVGTHGLHGPSNPCQVDLFAIDLHLSSIRLHFHDSSCIVASVALPAAKSSVAIHKDCLDVLCSTEGLKLSSSWWPQALQDSLWGPASPNLSPIINFRMRKGDLGSVESLVELNFSIQNVSCTLPPEFLAALIGYFSLPQWNLHAKESPATNNCKDKDTEDSVMFTYKFEILDSILFTPVANADYQLLKLDIPQLYCSFIENCDSDAPLEEIPSECFVPVQFIADQNHCLNLFGRDLSLYHLLLKDDGSDSLKINHNIELRSVSLISSFSGDMWIKIPNGYEPPCATSSSSICVMSRVSNCQFIVEGSNILGCFEALEDVIDQFSSVENLSRCYSSDVLQFLQLKRSYEDNGVHLIKSPSVTFTEIRCSIQSVSVKFYSPQIESIDYELIADADMKFTCSVSLKNDKPLCLDMSFTSLTLSSLLSSVLLVECTSSSQHVSVLHLNIQMSDEGENQLHFSLPCVNFWLYLSDCSRVIDLFNSFCVQLPKTAIGNEEPMKSTLDPSDHVGTPEYLSQSVSVSSYLPSEDIMQHQFSLIVNSDHLGIKVHIPVKVTGEALGYFGAPQVKDQNSLDSSYDDVGRDQYSFLVIYLQSRCTKLNIDGQKAILNSNLGKTTGTLELCQNKSVHSCPLFQLLQVDVEADFGDDEIQHKHLKAEVHCDNLDVWLSHHIFYFWQCMLFVFPEEAGSSQLPVYGVTFRFHLRKLSLLLTDQKWSSNSPLLEILMGSLLFHGVITENIMEGSVDGELQVNYNNIHKVLWEPFLEPWRFHVSLRREHVKSALQNSPFMTDIHVESAMNLNINVTESFIEVAFRTLDMIKDAWDLMGLNVHSENSRLTGTDTNENAHASRYAPYTLENLTSLPLVFYISKGCKNADGLDITSLKDGKYVHPGSSYPVYIDDNPEEQILRLSTSQSSDSLGDRQFADAQHHYIVVQLEGTSTLSTPISIDLVGFSYFEVDFSNSSANIGVDTTGDVSRGVKEFEGSKRLYTSNGYVIPVIVDVSVQRYTKLVRLYSTVVLLNATSFPFEVRFDIPFGVSPKILDPVYPGHEFPLPLHLAEAGRIRWRPLGSTYLWSEAYSISNILSNESKIGYLRSFVCYPSLPSSDPFRCCVSVHDMCLPSVGRINKGSSIYIRDALKQSIENSKGDKVENQDHPNKRCIHLVALSDPLIVKNYLPVTVSLMIESGGVTRSMLLSEVETSFYHIDSSHDLSLTFQMHGFRPSVLKFPRAEKFSEISKFSGTKFSSSESITFSADISNGPLYVTMEKVMDAFSGAREICIFVPFLLYNCCGFSLTIANSTNELKTHGHIVPSCYNLDEQDPPLGKKDGLSLLSSNEVLHNDGMGKFPINNNVVSTRKSLDTYHGMFLKEPFNLSGPSATIHGESDKSIDTQKSSPYNQERISASSSHREVKPIDFDDTNCKNVNFCMYSPDPNISSSEIMVRVSRCQSKIDMEKTSDCTWSNPFFLVPPTGSTTVLVPLSSTNGAYVISVASSAVAGPFSGRTRIINFQPRYVISNACGKDLCYRQKGSDLIYHLKVGQHSHIHWTDITRELLVSVRFDEPGWQWSGCFFPEHLGDTQLKMRNYVSGAVNMVRVEVQNADDAVRDEKIVGNPHGDSGTNLILLSDDDTGFMPYRIDNFSKERLRIYQQKCEAFETIIHSYTSCPYAWDEPCYPHRLTVEVFAERVIGSYSLDDAKEYKNVYLPATSEKPERRLLLSVHAEGALKVLSVIDSSYHIFDDTKSPYSPRLNDKREYDQKQESSVLYKERISVAIPFIGISLMSSQPQELLFACARNTMIDLVQSLDQQKFSLKIFSLQIDNQLPSTPYPVILSFDHEYKQILTSQMRTKDDSLRVKGEHVKQFVSDSSCEPVFSLAAAKWRNKDRALLSFEYINLRMTDFHLELEQDVILGLFDFFKTVSSTFHSRVMPDMDPLLHPLSSNFSVKMTSKFPEPHKTEKADGDLHPNSVPMFVDNQSRPLLPSIVPIGAPWQKIYLLARKQKKIYVELLEVAPITLTLSFSSSPWMLRNGILTSGEYLIHRGLMALADVEGAQIHLRRLTISHQLASLESIREILIIHYTRQLLHEMYKVFGSAGVIGNPMGFARSVGLGIKDFLSVPARSFMQSPAGLITGMAQGTTSLLSNTVYAISDAATQVSRAAHKGIVAFTMDDSSAMEMERQQKGMSSHGKGIINELLEGLTGLLQSPIRGAEKHGLPGVVSGIALGVTGLVARPAASILEVTEKTARSIRNRSKLYHMGSQRLRIRLPRPLGRSYPLRPYSWEEAVGVSVLADADDSLMLKDETLVLSKALKQGGKFVIITERLVLIVSCPSLVNLGKPEFRGVAADPDWIIEAEITLDSIIHVDTDEGVVHIVGSSSDVVLRQNQNQQKTGVTTGKQRWYKKPTQLPLFQTNLECSSKEEAGELLKVLLATIEKGKGRGWGCVYRLHQSNVK